MEYEMQIQMYIAAQSNLTRATDDQISLRRVQESMQQQYAEKNSQVNRWGDDKINLERRLQQVVQILSRLGSSVPNCISGVNSAANTAGQSFRGAIRCSEITSASLGTVFHTKSVEEDFHTASALSSCRAEKDRIETEIARLAASIMSMEQEMQGLSSSIAAQSSQIDELNRSISNYKEQVNEYRQYIYML